MAEDHVVISALSVSTSDQLPSSEQPLDWVKRCAVQAVAAPRRARYGVVGTIKRDKHGAHSLGLRLLDLETGKNLRQADAPEFLRAHRGEFDHDSVLVGLSFPADVGNARGRGSFKRIAVESDEGEVFLDLLLSRNLLRNTQGETVKSGPDNPTMRFAWAATHDHRGHELRCYVLPAAVSVPAGFLWFVGSRAWLLSDDGSIIYQRPDPTGAARFAMRIGCLSHDQTEIGADDVLSLKRLGIPPPPRISRAVTAGACSAPGVVFSLGSECDDNALAASIFVSVDGRDVDLSGDSRHYWILEDGGLVVRCGSGIYRVPGDAAQSMVRRIQASLSKSGIRKLAYNVAKTRTMTDAQRAPPLVNKARIAASRLPGGTVSSLIGLPEGYVAHTPSAARIEMCSDSEGASWSIGMSVDVNGERVVLPDLGDSLAADADFMEVLRIERMSSMAWTVAAPDGRHLKFTLGMLRDVLGPVLDFAESFLSGRSLRFSRMQAASIAEALDLPCGRSLDELRASIRATIEAARNESEEAPAGFVGALRPYQKAGVHWLDSLAAGGFGGILADDMGLGKTVQIIAHILRQREARPDAPPCLILAPKTVLLNWLPEIKQFGPSLKTLVLDGSERRSLFDQIPHADVVLTHYALLPYDHEALRDHRFSLAVLDEAQWIKNPATLASKVLRSLDVERYLPVTGTPLENHLGEVWSHLSLAVPEMFSDQAAFAQDYVTPIQRKGDSDRLTALRRSIQPFVMRRMKTDVAADLPPKTEIIKWVELPPTARGLYEQVRASQHASVIKAVSSLPDSQRRFLVLQALLRMRQVCCDPRLLGDMLTPRQRRDLETPKLDALVALLRESVEAGRRIIVFSTFAEMVKLIQERLKDEGIRQVAMMGETVDRQLVLENFRSGDADVLVMTIKVGGTGLNLTHADMVVHYDPWWNPASEAQATDRAHRIGQDKPVFVYKMVCSDTIEDRIVGTQQTKAGLARALLDGDGELGDRRSLDDLMQLFESAVTPVGDGRPCPGAPG